MSDVLKMIDDLRDRLWARYGDVLKKPREQDEVHMTYYVGELLKRRGHIWFKAPGVDGACYTEAAMQDAFTAGHRIGLAEAPEIAERLIADRIEAAHAALNGDPQ